LVQVSRAAREPACRSVSSACGMVQRCVRGGWRTVLLVGAGFVSVGVLVATTLVLGPASPTFTLLPSFSDPPAWEPPQTRNRTLIIIIGELRGGRAAHRSFLRYAADELMADIALCVSTPSLQSSPTLVSRAMYIWPVEELDDWGDAFATAALVPPDYAGASAFWHADSGGPGAVKVERGAGSTCDPPGRWGNATFVNRHCERGNERNKGTVAPCIGDTRQRWQQLLRINGQWLGGVRRSGQPGSAGILLVFRWLVQQRLMAEPRLLERYDTFILTRADYMYLCSHAPLSTFRAEEADVWVPEGQDFGGVTDRHTVMTRRSVMKVLNVTTSAIQDPVGLQAESKDRTCLNLEMTLKYYYRREHLRVMHFNRTMFAVMKVDKDRSRWAKGHVGRGMDITVAHKFGIQYKYLTELNLAKERCPVGAQESLLGRKR